MPLLDQAQACLCWLFQLKPLVRFNPPCLLSRFLSLFLSLSLSISDPVHLVHAPHKVFPKQEVEVKLSVPGGKHCPTVRLNILAGCNCVNTLLFMLIFLLWQNQQCGNMVQQSTKVWARTVLRSAPMLSPMSHCACSRPAHANHCK